MTPEQIYLNLIDKERNIYEPAQLFHQNRENVSNYIDNMRSPGDNEGILSLDGNHVKCAKNGKVFTKSKVVVPRLILIILAKYPLIILINLRTILY